MLTGTPNFAISEALNASGGTIPPQYQDNAQQVLEFLQALRAYVNSPIVITSLYRSATDNADVGGAADSQHLQALAADFDILGMTSLQAMSALYNGVQAGAVPSFYQAITYQPPDNHLHVGIAAGSWSANNELLQEIAAGQYEDVDPDTLAMEAADTSVLDDASNLATQAADVVAYTPAAKWILAGLVALMSLPWILKLSPSRRVASTRHAAQQAGAA